MKSPYVTSEKWSKNKRGKKNWYQAVDECRFIGKKLPTIKEVLNAYKSGLAKKWGDEEIWSSIRCNPYKDKNCKKESDDLDDHYYKDRAFTVYSDSGEIDVRNAVRDEMNFICVK